MSDLSADAQQKVFELKRAYIESFPEKVISLESCWRNLEATRFSAIQLENLRKACHKIAGSSGSYEMLEISQVAKIIEQLCSNGGEDIVNNDKSRSELKAHFQMLVKLLDKHG